MTLVDDYESAFRLAVFAGVLVAMALLERVAPRRSRVQAVAVRWRANLALVVIDTLALRIFMPVLAVGMAHMAEQKGWGILSMIAAPYWLEVMITVMALDMLIYAQHVASHKLPFLWALHKVHHADRDIDVTTGLRFHPFEILLSMAFKLLCIILLGAPALAVLIFEVLLNASSMFNHANWRLPLRVDTIVRRLIVTPDMHRVHHSVLRQETDSNYGFFLSLWDRLFKTYRAEPQMGHDDMTIGLEAYQSDKPARLVWCLTAPFRR